MSTLPPRVARLVHPASSHTVGHVDDVDDFIKRYQTLQTQVNEQNNITAKSGVGKGIALGSAAGGLGIMLIGALVAPVGAIPILLLALAGGTAGGFLNKGKKNKAKKEIAGLEAKKMVIMDAVADAIAEKYDYAKLSQPELEEMVEDVYRQEKAGGAKDDPTAALVDKEYGKTTGMPTDPKEKNKYILEGLQKKNKQMEAEINAAATKMNPGDDVFKTRLVEQTQALHKDKLRASIAAKKAPTI